MRRHRLTVTDALRCIHQGWRFCIRWLLCLIAGGLLAAEADPAFEKASLGWRTALHFDPGAEAPLNSLVQLYRQAGRAGELVSLYQNHLSQFGQDEGAKVVLARLLVVLQNEQASEFLKEAMQQHPQNALLVRAHAAWLEYRKSPQSLAELDRAIGLETPSARQTAWLTELIQKAALANQETLVTERFKQLVQQNTLSPIQRMQWARRMLDAGLKLAAREAVAGADLSRLSGEEMIDAQMTLARIQLANNEPALAAKGLDATLEKLAGDHWRRRELLTLRWQAAATESERATLLQAAEERFNQKPGDESTALAYADFLVASGKREPAIEVLRQALVALPVSRLLESRLLDWLEQWRRDDEALAFLKEQLVKEPQREDLRLRQARWLLMLGRSDEGQRAMETLLTGLGPAQRLETVLQTARWLRSRHLYGEAAQVLEVLSGQTGKALPASLRKELAELYVLLKKNEQVDRLFATPLPEETPSDVRLEVAQFLLAQQKGKLARQTLESWVMARSAEFDGRLLLARIAMTLGDEPAAEKWLQECRERCDTDVRYAAWLALAWERAVEAETTAALLTNERGVLFPKAGESWDASQLTRLALLAEQSARNDQQAEAERFIREVISTNTLPRDQRATLQRQLLQLMENQKGREKEVEKLLQDLIADETALGRDDLQLQLALFYYTSQRFDLARTAFEGIQIEKCQELDLLQSAATACQQLGLESRQTAVLKRLLQLKPEDQGLWIAWTKNLALAGKEEELRSALREMQQHGSAWNLDDASKQRLRQHLAASYWRTVAQGLATGAESDSMQSQVLAALNELESLEVAEKRQVWVIWARGQLAMQQGNEALRKQSLEKLKASDASWVNFPDGLSLSMEQACAVLEGKGSVFLPATSSAAPAATAAPQPPLEMAWGFQSEAQLQRWALSPDGQKVLILDSMRQLQALDRSTGKLLWRAEATELSPRLVSSRGGRRGTQQNGMESISGDWLIGGETVCLLDDSGLTAYRLSDGRLQWKVESGELAESENVGCLAGDAKQVLWWQPQEGRLDAIDSQSGRLLWTQSLSAIAKPPAVNANDPVWIATGVSVDSGAYVVWGNGTVIGDVKTGKLLWKAGEMEASLAFPLEIYAVDTPEMPSLSRQAPIPWTMVGTISGRNSRSSRNPVNRFTLTTPMGVPGYGFPGMYGSSLTSPWVTWGAEDYRILRGGGVWQVSNQFGATRFSILGLPISAPGASDRFAGYQMGQPVGFVGRALVVASQYGLFRVLPDGDRLGLWNSQFQNGQSKRVRLPACALAGRVLLLAEREQCLMLDALSGNRIWEGELPPEAKSWCQDEWESMDRFQSARWSSKGVWLADGQGRMLALEWKSLSAEGDWIIPAGLRKLVCLRSSADGKKKEEP